MISSGAKLRYVFQLKFDGFLPRLAPNAPEFLSYGEWIAGRPHLAGDVRMAFVPIDAAEPAAPG